MLLYGSVTLYFAICAVLPCQRVSVRIAPQKGKYGQDTRSFILKNRFVHFGEVEQFGNGHVKSHG